MVIRSAGSKDFDALYTIGLATPEFQVSGSEAFMDPDEFRWAITENPDKVFLLAEEDGKIVGFVYANAKDGERPFPDKYACLVYLVVIPECRPRGIAKQLYETCEKELKAKGITHMYGWANTEGDGAIGKFMKGQGYTEGHLYRWMDKRL